MFGILRLLLAALVAASHCGLTLAGLNPGVVAVVVFYLLAGYVMQDQLVRYFPAAGDTPRFYRDRLLRLYPLYLFYLGLTLLLVLALDYRRGFLADGLTPAALAQNLLIIPLDYYMYTGIDRATLIPPAWSLGAELQFYLLAPLLLRGPWRFWSAYGASSLIFLAAAAGWLHTDHWGYRLLPGVLFLFLTGALLRAPRLRHRAPPHTAHLAWLPRTAPPPAPLALAVAALAYLLARAAGNLHAPFLREVLTGLLAGLALIPLLERLPPRPWDLRLGYLAYALFLAHFLPIFALDALGGPAPGTPAHLALVLASALALAELGWRLVERPVVRWRKAWRQRPRAVPFPQQKAPRRGIYIDNPLKLD